MAAKLGCDFKKIFFFKIDISNVDSNIYFAI